MSTRRRGASKLLAYAGALGMLTLGAILLSIRQQLLAVGPWVLDILLAALGAVLLFGMHRLYVNFRLDHLRLRERELNIAQQQQNLLGAETDRQILLDRHMLDRHIALTRIFPQQGLFPVLVNDAGQGDPTQANVLALPQYARGGQRALPPGAPAPDQAQAMLPESVSYEAIAHMVPKGHGLLGVDSEGVKTAGFENFMTMLFTGGSHSGKSNTVAIKIREALDNGKDMRILLIDWHAQKDDSLYKAIREYEYLFLRPVVTDEEETHAVLEWFLSEFLRRREQGLAEGDHDILLIVDEVPAVLDEPEDEKIPGLLKRVAKKCGRESRGFGMYGWFVAQQAIGIAWLRTVVHTVIGHKAVMLNEAEIVCNGHKDIARSMETWPIGRVIVYGQNFQGVKVLQMPVKQPFIVEADPPMEPLARKPRPDVLGTRAASPAGFIYADEDPGPNDAAQNFFELEDDEIPLNVRTFPRGDLTTGQETPDGPSQDRPGEKEYRFTEAEIPALLAAWRASRNVDIACRSTGHSAPRYRAHAKEILTAHGLLPQQRQAQ